jgi:aspartate racemase
VLDDRDDREAGVSDAPELRTVGVLGGMASASTVEYYRRLDAGVNDVLGGHDDADLLIRSVNFGPIERRIDEGAWEGAGEQLAAAAADLEAGGADLVVLATNTMHRVAPRIVEALSVPFLHIVDVTADAVRAAGLETVGVLGTRATMEGAFYADRFAEHGVETVTPDRATRETVDRVIFDELTHGEVREPSREAYLGAIDDLVTAGAEGIVFGCTEIDLLLDAADVPVPVFDTTALHVGRAVERSLEPVV